MRHHLVVPVLWTLSVVLLAACSSGGGGGGNGSLPPLPTVSLSANPTLVATHSSTQLTWTSTNASSCTASGGWSGARPTSGTEQVSNLAAPTTFTLVCTGGGRSSLPASVTVTVMQTATAHAGLGRLAYSGAEVRLSGEASQDPEGAPLQYAWTQTGGTPLVTLSGANTVSPTFTAPDVSSNTTLTFSLVVNDGVTGPSAPDEVFITIRPVPAGNVLVTGNIRFVRIPFGAAASAGLDYSAPVEQPARAVLVRALQGGTELDSGPTDSAGHYTLAVPQNASVSIQAVSRMVREGLQPAPGWNVTVRDVEGGANAYAFESAVFSSGMAGVIQDLLIPSGLNTSGAATGVRASAPFAILDTLYQGLQTVISVEPDAVFPTLTVDWATNNPGGDTYFDTGAQTIVLSAQIGLDTDEFDHHVIAHEFGHYIEHNFSRADNIGGGHALGDKLDARVAFGEGFGYAFAAIVMKDPLARDSFVFNGSPVSSTFNVETNPQTSTVGAPNNDFGCWCSESSVWSLLWDFYDNNSDANDGVALGFVPLWTVLTQEQRTTEAFTTIFSFAEALRNRNPSAVASIDTLLIAQNIDAANINAFATGETHAPPPVANAAALPLYTTATVGGGAVVVRNVDDAGNYNALGNHRYIRFSITAPRSVTITLNSSNPNDADPDFLVWKAGQLIGLGFDPPPQPETKTFNLPGAGTYLIDVYDCANGCSTPQGTPGDYDLNVTIN